jgi:hypothetical protein
MGDVHHNERDIIMRDTTVRDTTVSKEKNTYNKRRFSNNNLSLHFEEAWWVTSQEIHINEMN